VKHKSKAPRQAAKRSEKAYRKAIAKSEVQAHRAAEKAETRAHRQAVKAEAKAHRQAVKAEIQVHEEALKAERRAHKHARFANVVADQLTSADTTPACPSEGVTETATLDPREAQAMYEAANIALEEARAPFSQLDWTKHTREDWIAASARLRSAWAAVDAARSLLRA
jgi:hypothetical protein